MTSYWFAWMPAALVVGVLTLLAIPYLALVVLVGVLFAAIAGIGWLVWATASAAYRLPRRLAGGPARTAAEPVPVALEPASARRHQDDSAGLALGPYAGTP